MDIRILLPKMLPRGWASEKIYLWALARKGPVRTNKSQILVTHLANLSRRFKGFCGRKDRLDKQDMLLRLEIVEYLFCAFVTLRVLTYAQVILPSKCRLSGGFQSCLGKNIPCWKCLRLATWQFECTHACWCICEQGNVALLKLQIIILRTCSKARPFCTKKHLLYYLQNVTSKQVNESVFLAQKCKVCLYLKLTMACQHFGCFWMERFFSSLPGNTWESYASLCCCVRCFWCFFFMKKVSLLWFWKWARLSWLLTCAQFSFVKFLQSVIITSNILKWWSKKCDSKNLCVMWCNYFKLESKKSI